MGTTSTNGRTAQAHDAAQANGRDVVPVMSDAALSLVADANVCRDAVEAYNGILAKYAGELRLIARKVKSVTDDGIALKSTSARFDVETSEREASATRYAVKPSHIPNVVRQVLAIDSPFDRDFGRADALAMAARLGDVAETPEEEAELKRCRRAFDSFGEVERAQQTLVQALNSRAKQYQTKLESLR